MKSIFNITSFGVFEHKEGKIVNINQKGASILGYKPDEVKSKHFLRFMDPEERKKIHSMIRSGIQKKYFIRGIKKNGKYVNLIVYPDAKSISENTIRVGLFREI